MSDVPAERSQDVRIIRARRYAVKPMSVDEAALEVGETDGRVHGFPQRDGRNDHGDLPASRRESRADRAGSVAWTGQLDTTPARPSTHIAGHAATSGIAIEHRAIDRALEVIESDERAVRDRGGPPQAAARNARPLESNCSADGAESSARSPARTFRRPASRWPASTSTFSPRESSSSARARCGISKASIAPRDCRSSARCSATTSPA